MSTTGLLVDPALIQCPWKWPSGGLLKTLWQGRWIYDMVWWYNLRCFMEISAIIYTPEGQKPNENGRTKGFPPSSPENCKFLTNFTVYSLIEGWTCLWYADVLPASKIQPIWFPPPRRLTVSSDQIQTQYSQFEQLAHLFASCGWSPLPNRWCFHPLCYSPLSLW